MLAVDWLKRMERRTILGGGVFALTLLALVCIPVTFRCRPLLLYRSRQTYAQLEQGALMLADPAEAGAHERILEQAPRRYRPHPGP